MAIAAVLILAIVSMVRDNQSTTSSKTQTLQNEASHGSLAIIGLVPGVEAWVGDRIIGTTREGERLSVSLTAGAHTTDITSISLR
jgi:hypothetical protein